MLPTVFGATFRSTALRCMLVLSAHPAVWAQSTTVWQVGPQRDLKLPSAAAEVAGHGDTIAIDAGRYDNDYAVWHQDDLTIRGVGGMAHLHSSGHIPNGKGIWLINGDNTVIENVEFSGASVRSTNGAGIRHQGGDLTLRNTFFHDNEFSVLSGRNTEAVIEVRDSRFWFQRRETRFSHGIYIGAAKRFTLIGSHFKGTDRGHQVKSRALANHILYNRIEDVAGGNSSRLIDLPNCGQSFVIGNDLHQAATSDNFNAIGYGLEGCEDRTPAQRRLVVVNNTFINEAPAATFVSNRSGQALVVNNYLLGNGTWLRGAGETRGNVREGLSGWTPGRWRPAPDSAAIDAAARAETPAQMTPDRQFNPPAGTAPRPRSGPLDAGSREWVAPSPD